MRKLECSLIVPVTKKDLADGLEHTLEERFEDYEVIRIEGAASMAEVWKRGVGLAKRNFIGVIHEDIEIYDWVDLKKELARGVGVVGVAGARQISATHPFWFNQERLWRGRLSGQVYQRARGREWLMKYGEYGEVVVLDGVCLVSTKKKLGSLEWLEKLDWAKWNWYDHLLSLKLGKKYRLKTVPIQLAHFSSGERVGAADADKEKLLEWIKKEGFGLKHSIGGKVERALV